MAESKSVTVEIGDPKGGDETGSIFEDFRSSDSTNPDKNAPNIRVYSTDGQSKSLDQYIAAMNEYSDTKAKTGKGTITGPFTALEIGSGKEQARSLFEKINRPIQNVAQSPWLTDTHGMLVSKLTGQEYKPATGLMGKLSRLNSPGAGISFMAEQINTPGKALGTAALAGVPGLSQVSGILPTAVRAGAAGLGHMVGDTLTGTAETEASDRPILDRASTAQLITVASVAAADGITGVISSVLGRSLTAKATKQVNDDILASIKAKYPELTYSGKAGVEAYASTKDGLADITRIGVKALKGDGDELAKEFISDLRVAMPLPEKDRALHVILNSKKPIIHKEFEKDINSLLKRYDTEVNTVLDNIGNDKIKSIGMGKIEEIRGELTKRISKQFNELTTSTNEVKLGQDLLKLMNTMEKYTEAQETFKAGAEVLSVLKQSGQGAGTNPQQLQRFIHDKLKGEGLPGSSLMDDMMSGASRGASPGSIDSSPSKMLRDVPNRFVKAFGYIPTATHFTGTVRGTTPFRTIEAVTKGTLNDFFTRKDSKQE